MSWQENCCYTKIERDPRKQFQQNAYSREFLFCILIDMEFKNRMAFVVYLKMFSLVYYSWHISIYMPISKPSDNYTKLLLITATSGTSKQTAIASCYKSKQPAASSKQQLQLVNKNLRLKTAMIVSKSADKAYKQLIRASTKLTTLFCS
jgi:hypothetical protein